MNWNLVVVGMVFVGGVLVGWLAAKREISSRKNNTSFN